ncbi:methylated-DNA--[protein]-cysteine S-methyltransferase [Nitratireductor indicus]|uniref:methylated-DNA--[protein]-cysteine S-methyltransferase n=1 Tax=Nitratireductor indicus TaxID=721133 RepID=UPI00287619DD|nr:methylated-DNA--[protein]-cysteine S-methyltransferase [Nitratireductor indicus]MDS1135833.1 methylated-DNA--[protein]-cysteine S-methyltransferase [Nitratireductor indicus]
MNGHHIFDTEFGFCGAGWSDAGLTHFVLPMPHPGGVAERLAKHMPASAARMPTGAINDLIAAATRYFAGNREDFSHYPVDLSGQSPFHTSLYLTMRELAYGETTTYGMLCAKVGHPTATRETGVAMGRNPMPLIIPCHRVLAAGGRIGGFSAHGGLDTKRRMLALENARSPNPIPDQASFSF